MIMPQVNNVRLLRTGIFELAEIKCLYMNIPINKKYRYKECMIKSLSDSEKKKIQRLHRNPFKQTAILTSRFWTKWLVSKCLQQQKDVSLQLKDISILNQENGQPFVNIHGENREDSVSISYTADKLLIGYSEKHKIGVDIETSVSLESSFIDLVYSKSEKNTIERMFGADNMKGALLIWCMKEAVLKDLGIGFSYGYQAIEFVMDEENQQWYIIDNKNLLGENRKVHIYYEISDIVCAVICVLNEE